MFAIVYAAVAREEHSESGYNSNLPEELREFSDTFSNKKVGTLPPFKQGDYTIKIEDRKEPPYRPLYNLS